MKISQIVKFIASLFLTLGFGAIAGFFNYPAIPEWYASLSKPVFNPPNWIFGPVWTSIYLILGISLFLIWKTEPGKDRNLAILLFGLQLLLNFCWSFIFFYFHLIGLAVIEIILLWISILIMLIQFHKIKPLAAYLNIAYLLWVTFATILNASFYFLN